MGLVAGDLASHFTQVDPAFEQKRNKTQPGMAHFAGSGPEGLTCRQCEHWTGCGQESGYYAKNGKHGGVLKPRSCAKYQRLMQGEVGPGVPHETSACKYFDVNMEAPAVTYK